MFPTFGGGVLWEEGLLGPPGKLIFFFWRETSKKNMSMFKLHGYKLDDEPHKRQEVINYISGDYGAKYVIRAMLAIGEFHEVMLDDLAVGLGDCMHEDDWDEYRALKNLWKEGRL